MTMSVAAAPRPKTTRSTEDRLRSAWVGACRRKARRHAGKPTPAVGSVHSSPFRSGFWLATWADEDWEGMVLVNHAEEATLVDGAISGDSMLNEVANATSWTWHGRGMLPRFANRHVLHDRDEILRVPIDCLPGD
jgi:hypothetical protein